MSMDILQSRRPVSIEPRILVRLWVGYTLVGTIAVILGDPQNHPFIFGFAAIMAGLSGLGLVRIVKWHTGRNSSARANQPLALRLRQVD